MADSTRSQAILREMEEIMNGKIQAQMQTSASKVREEQQKAIEELQQSTTAIKSSFDRIHDDMARLKEMIRALRREKIPPPASSIPEAQTDVDLGAPSVNSDIAPSIQPTPSNFPPSMSTNYGGQTTNNWGADSFMSSQGESYCPDSLYRDSNFGVHQHNSSNFGVPQQSNSDFSFPYSRTVLVKIHSELYPISHEVLDWFFSGIGKLESIECFDQCSPFHSRICFQDRDSAVRAVHWLDGSCIYNGCCQVELILKAETMDRATDMDVLNQQTPHQESWSQTFAMRMDSSLAMAESIAMASSFSSDVHQLQVEESIEAPLDSSKAAAQLVIVDSEAKSVETKESEAKVIEDNGEPCFDGEFPISSMALIPVVSEALNPANNENVNLVGKMGLAEVELKIDDTLISKNSIAMNAYKVFEEMPNKKHGSFGFSVDMEDKAMLGVHVDPINFSIVENIRVVPVPIYDPGGIDKDSENCVASEGKIQACFCEKYELLLFPSADCKGKTMDLLRNQNGMLFDRRRLDMNIVKEQLIQIFDPGGMLGLSLVVWNWFIDVGSGCLSMEVQLVSVRHFVFDPGGISFW